MQNTSHKVSTLTMHSDNSYGNDMCTATIQEMNSQRKQTRVDVSITKAGPNFESLSFTDFCNHSDNSLPWHLITMQLILVFSSDDDLQHSINNQTLC